MPRLQSACRQHHSIETELLQVLSDFYSAAEGHVILLGLLDFSSALDCFDHYILVRRLQLSYGFESSALACVVSFRFLLSTHNKYVTMVTCQLYQLLSSKFHKARVALFTIFGRGVQHDCRLWASRSLVR